MRVVDDAIEAAAAPTRPSGGRARVVACTWRTEKMNGWAGVPAVTDGCERGGRGKSIVVGVLRWRRPRLFVQLCVGHEPALFVLFARASNPLAASPTFRCLCLRRFCWYNKSSFRRSTQPMAAMIVARRCRSSPTGVRRLALRHCPIVMSSRPLTIRVAFQT